MRSLTIRLLLSLMLMMPGLFAGAQTPEPAGKAADSSGSATKQEVDQLRAEVAAQRQTIEQLKAMVQQLVDAKSQPAATDGAQVVNATLVSADQISVSAFLLHALLLGLLGDVQQHAHAGQHHE